jgi:tubulin beta
MREVIMLHVGGCGTSLGAKVWEAIMPEHSLDVQGVVASDATTLQKEMLNVYFNESRGGRYVPRAVLVDSEPGNLDRIRAGEMGQLFRSDSYIASRGTSGGIFTKGYYEVGPEIIDITLDAIRREVESADSLQGFQLTRSVSGGTGSGFGTLLLGRLKQEFGTNAVLQCFNIFPNTKTSDNLTENYNTVLSVGRSYPEGQQASTIMDNAGLIDIAIKKLGIKSPTFDDLNMIAAKGIAGVTSAIRFPGIQNTSLRKILSNLIPFPRLCLSILSHTLANQSGSTNHMMHDGESLVREGFDPKSFMTTIDPRHGRYITAFASFRGNIPSAVAQSQAENVLKKNSSYFVEWIPQNINIGMGFQSPKDCDCSLSVLANSTAAQSALKSSGEKFTAMFRRKGFMCWYLAAGADEMEFTEAESNMNDLVSEYQQYQDASSDDAQYQEE